jgi:hypothetical protein
MQINKQRVVVSLTTIPSRIQYIQKTIDSLLQQSVAIDEIYVAIPQKKLTPEKSSLNYDLSVLQKLQVTIVELDYDYGPVCKLIGALIKERNPETKIITVDDDVIYPKDTLKDLLEQHQSGEATSFGGASLSRLPPFIKVQTTLFGETPSCISRIIEFGKASEVDWLLGTAAVLFERSSFQDDAIPLLCQWSRDPCMFKADDVTISAYLSMKGVSRRMIYPKVKPVLTQKDQGLPEALSANLVFALKNHVSTYLKLKHKYQAFDKPNDAFLPSLILSFVLFLLLLFFLSYKLFIR